MIIYLQSMDYNLWEAVMDEPDARTRIIDGKTVENHLRTRIKMVRRNCQ